MAGPVLIFSSPRDVMTVENTNIDLSCAAMTTFNFPPPEITWFKSSESLGNALTMKISTRATRRTSSRLHLSNVTTSDSGVYRCRARVKGYSDVAEAEVIVRKSAKFDEQKKKKNNNSNPPETTSAERGHSSLLLAESTTPSTTRRIQETTSRKIKTIKTASHSAKINSQPFRRPRPRKPARKTFHGVQFGSVTRPWWRCLLGNSSSIARAGILIWLSVAIQTIV